MLDSAGILSVVTVGGFTKFDSADASTLITTAINSLVGGAPAALDTLNELAAALNNDSNFAANVTNLITALPDSSQVVTLINSTVDSAYIQARQITYNFLDSAEAVNLIDSAYVQARQLTYNFLDSSEAVNLIDSAYIQARQSTTATTLATSRNIWGQSFNGGADVTGNLTSVGNITGTGALVITATGANNVTITTNSVERMRVDSSGNVGIGTTSPSVKLEVTGNIKDTLGPVRAAPIQTKSGAYVVVAADAGTTIYISTGGVTFNASILSAGDMVTIVNNSASNQTITSGASVTFRLSGTATTGNRTLAQYGMATFLCVVGGATPTFHCSGAGLT